ncbi:MAG: ATP-binding protein [Bacteroidota bacterium]
MKNIFVLLFVVCLISCKNSDHKLSIESTDKAVLSASVEGKPKSIELNKLWETEATLKTAESVLFDEKRGVYYVSCIGGVPPTKEDGDGFIALVDQKGKILNKSFVTGIDAPKGMALSGGQLFVTDINELVIINPESGEVIKRIPVEGAKFLNDVAAAPDGSIYFTDMNTNSVHRYMNKKLELFLQDESLSNPNGIYVDNETIYLASFRKGDFNTVNIESKEITKRVSEVIPGGDGVEPWNGGFFVSNWNGEVHYVSSDWETTKVLDIKEEKLNAADIGLNAKSGELLIPTFFGNSVVAYKITDVK